MVILLQSAFVYFRAKFLKKTLDTDSFFSVDTLPIFAIGVALGFMARVSAFVD